MSLTTSEGLGFRDLVFSDLLRYRPNRRATWRGVLKTCLSSPGMIASLVLRAQQSAFRAGRPRLAYLLRTLGMVLISADFVPGAEVGPGLSIPHPSAVVIGNGVIIGANVSFGVGVVAGVRKADLARGEYPVICDGAIILSHSVVAGPVRVGSHAQVGANSLVLSDVADHHVVLGVPAQKIGIRGDRIPGASDRISGPDAAIDPAAGDG